jgi:transcriptional regulator
MKRQTGVDQQMIRDAMAMRQAGKTQMEIADKLRVAQGTVSVILRANGAGGRLVRPRRSLLLRPEE